MRITTMKNINGSRIAVIGNYLPRECGIATFTYDLVENMSRLMRKGSGIDVLAMNDRKECYEYPERVKFQITENSTGDYIEAAEYINQSGIELVNLQHEYGIFGGKAGEKILLLLEKLRKPLIVTCHTICKYPKKPFKEVLEEITARATRLIVMSKKAKQFLNEYYEVDSNKIVIIPHGIHDVPFEEPRYFKKKFGVCGCVILTFGLLQRTKGIEFMIEAMPAILKKHPNTTYVILGATHPRVALLEGELYREGLKRRVNKLNLGNNVLFYPKFVILKELLDCLQAADIFVTPYISKEYIASGALSYAVGCGKVVVSTPYWYAEELLADGRGIIVPMQSPEALSRSINEVLDDENRFNLLRRKAYLWSRHMIWPKVAALYLKLFDDVKSKEARLFPAIDLQVTESRKEALGKSVLGTSGSSAGLDRSVE